MAGKSVRKSGRFYVVIYLVFLFCFILPTVSSMIFAMKETARYGLEYDKDPLLMKNVKLVNRGTSYGGYEADEGCTLCEVILTYENVGWYTSEYSDRPEFYGQYEDSSEEYLGLAWFNSESDLYYEAADDNPIPAGKIGSRRYLVEIWPDMRYLEITENGEKLEGSCQTVMLEIPDLPGESESVMVTGQ